MKIYLNSQDASEKLSNKIDKQLNKVIFMPVSRIESGTAAGDCSCVVTKEGRSILIDTGASHSYELIKSELIKNDINKIDYVIISHYHSDHCQNLESLKNDFDMSTTEYYLCKHTDKFTYSDNYVLTQIGDNKKSYPNNNDVLEVDDLKFTFFNCSQSDIDFYDNNTTNYNDYSMCCYCENERYSILFSGDINTAAQARINELGFLKKVNVLKIEHHGADNTVNHDYIKILNPEYSVVSDSDLKYTKENILCESVRIQNSMGVKTFCVGKETVVYTFNEYFDHINGIYQTNAVFKDMRTYNLIYLDVNYAGISDGSFYKPFRTLREALALAYTLMPCNVQIATKDGSLFESDEHVRIVNFYPNLKLDKIKIRQLHIINSNVSLGEVEVYDSNNRPVYIDQSNVAITSLTVTGDVTSADTAVNGRGVVIYNSIVHANKIIASNKRIALCVYNSSNVFVSSLEGQNNEYATVCAGGAKLGTQSFNIECDNKVYSGDKTSTYIGAFTNDLTSYLAEGDDLNNFKTVGTRYVSKTGAITISLLNKPNNIGYSMVLTVEKQTEDGSIMQVIRSRHLNGDATTGIWIRTYNPTDGWGLWYKNKLLDKMSEIPETHYVIPEMFGAKRDGVTDDTEAIQAAIDYAHENGKIVQLLGGTYATGKVQVYKGTQIRGQGMQKTIIFLKSHSDEPFIEIVEDANSINITHLTLSDFTIDGNKFGNNCPAAFYFNQDGDTHHTISNIEIRIVKGHGIRMKRGENRLSNLYIHHCDGYGIYHDGSDNFFEGVSCAWNYQGGVAEYGSSDKWINCKCFVNGEYYGNDNLENLKSPGFLVNGGARSVFANCESQENYGHGWYIDNHPLLQIVNCSADQNGMINKGKTSGFDLMGGFTLGAISNMTLFGACTNFRGANEIWQRAGLVMLSANCSNVNINLNCTEQAVNHSGVTDKNLFEISKNNIIIVNNEYVNKPTISTVASDLNSTVTLANELKTALKNLGIIK